MYYASIKSGKVHTFGTLQQLFPTTAFPLSGPNEEFLKEHDLQEVIQMIEHDEKKQHVVYCEPYVKDLKVYMVEIEDMTKEQIAENKAATKLFKDMQGATDAK